MKTEFEYKYIVYLEYIEKCLIERRRRHSQLQTTVMCYNEAFQVCVWGQQIN